MEKFRYSKEWENECRQNIGWKESCADCLYEALCLFQKNQESILKKSQKSDTGLEKNKDLC